MTNIFLFYRKRKKKKKKENNREAEREKRKAITRVSLTFQKESIYDKRGKKEE